MIQILLCWASRQLTANVEKSNWGSWSDSLQHIISIPDL